MPKILKKYQSSIYNIVFALLLFPLLFIISLVNIENIYQFNLSDKYTILYLIYLFVGILLLFFPRIFKLNDGVFKEEFIYTSKSIFLLSFLLIPSFFLNHYFIIERLTENDLYLRSYGKIAFFYFALALSVTPILRFVKKIKIKDSFILSRKIFGILAFVFFVKHSLEYYALEYIFQSQYHTDVSYLKYVYDNMYTRYDALSGFIVGILMLLLGITSNKISIKILSGKKWKMLQSLAYPAFLLSVIHIAFASRFDNFYIFLFVFVIFIRSLAFLSNKSNKNKGTTQKYRCIPCGYIYDENIGDPDSGIAPGTKFEDIPDDWYCPVCGVTKADFEPYYSEDNTVFGGYLGKIIAYKMLTTDVLELSIEVKSNLKVKKGQYAILKLRDFDGEFSRAYSIVKYKNNILKFGIKLKDIGRGGRKLKNSKIGDGIKIQGIHGDFILQENSKPKVFIATGTGLSPIINMLSDTLKSNDNHLFFGVQSKSDLFYMSKIQKLENFTTHIYLSREEVKGFNYGRIDLNGFDFDKSTEFYICGNPGLVNSTRDFLEKEGYKNIYFEKFN